PATRAINAAHIFAGAKNSAARKPAIRNTAVMTRSLSIATTARHLLAGTAETAFARTVRGNRLFERKLIEIGPQRVGEIQLRIGKLPEQEIADALLAAGADEQIGLRRVVHRQLRRDLLLAEIAAAGVTAGQPVKRRDDVPAPAIVGGHGQHQTVVAGSERF